MKPPHVIQSQREKQSITTTAMPTDRDRTSGVIAEQVVAANAHLKQEASVDATQVARVQFLQNWNNLYPETPPISHLFKERLPKRCARIHSLPEAKRYPSIKAEWDELLDRQNRVIDSLVQQSAAVQFVINFIEIDCYLFQSFNLENVGVFVDEARETAFQSFTFETTWERHTLNPVLMMIAHGDLKAFIMAPDCLIAPYEGGMDIILKDPHTCWSLKRQFKGWLSRSPSR